MRFEGTLARWNGDRGFGFIVPAQGGQELFVHISAFPLDGRRPQLHEHLSFEVALGKDGKKQAAAIQRPRSATPLSVSRPRRPPPQMARGPSTGLFGKLGQGCWCARCWVLEVRRSSIKGPCHRCGGRDVEGRCVRYPG